MAYDSNVRFHQGLTPSPFYDHHMVSFQAGAVSGSNRLFPSAISTIDAINSMDAMAYTPTPTGSNMPLMIPSESTAGVLHLDPIPALRHDTGLAIEWSLEEQALLDRGLAKYSSEPNIMKYVKIAAMLDNKTVRDVALRCRWMTVLHSHVMELYDHALLEESPRLHLFLENKDNVKRRKQDEYCVGKKMKDRKEKQVDCSPTVNVISSQLPNVPFCPFTVHHVDSCSGITHEVSSIDGATQLLLEETTQLLFQIESNLGSLKLQDNVDLFFHTKNNVFAILKRMHEMPGIMSRMPPLPESIDEKLFDTLLCAPQALMLCTPGGIIHLKQEPRC